MSIYTYFITFILGASIASLLNVIAHDLPLGINWTTRHSVCPHCNTRLRATELIPLLSYLFQKGRCLSCHTKISFLYPLIEMVGGTLFMIPLLLPDHDSLLQLVHTWILFSLLITITLTDSYYGLIPNKILITFGTGLLIIQLNLFSAIISFFLFFLSAHIGKWLFKKKTIGGGDMKLYFVIGLAVELPILLPSIVTSCVLALLYMLLLKKDRLQAIRFGPFISLGVIIVIILSSI